MNPKPHRPVQGDGTTDPEAARKSQRDPHGRRNAFIPGFHSRPPFKIWLRNNWLDIITQLLCVLAAFMLYILAPPLVPRYFPLYAGIEHSAFGIKYGKPYMSEYITTLVSAIVSYVAPLLVMGGIGLWWSRDFADGNAAIMGLGYALATSTIFQAFIKLFVGGLRPHFLSICAPAIPPPGPGMMTPGPMSGVFYKASQVCTGDGNKVREAQMSFPSGHACAAFAGFGFLALWMNAKFKVFGEGRRSGFPHAQNTPNTAGETNDESENNEVGEKDERGGGRIQHWKFVLFATPWCLAFLLAGSKVRDEWHHPVDVIFGALVGTAFAHLAYRMVYRSIYNSRQNHIPREH